MGLFENIFGTNPRYTVKDNKTGDETQVRDAKDLEKFAEREQDKKPDQPPDFWQRIFSK